MSELSALAMVIAEQKEQIIQLELDVDTITRRAERFEVQFELAKDNLNSHIDSAREYREEISYLNGELQGFINAMGAEVTICDEEPSRGSIVQCSGCGTRFFRYLTSVEGDQFTWICQDDGSILSWDELVTRTTNCGNAVLELVYRG